jgi:uncharacterized protein (TIGR00730 family)
MKMKNVAVYCGANKGNHPIFISEATKLGRLLAQNQIEVVYGGGSVGLMGVLADALLEEGGSIRGIITHQLDNLEVGHKGVANMVAVATMSERKTMLLDGTDGVITLAGGYGSMDEIFEALCLAQLHLYHKPIGLLNTMGFYDPFIAQLDNMVNFGFLKPENRALCIIESEIEPLLEKMEAYTYNPIPKWM